MKDRKPIRLIASDLDGTLYYGARELGKTGVYAGGNHP